MATFRLTLEYDGSDFHGWQRQPGMRTVEGELRAALARVGDADADLNAANTFATPDRITPRDHKVAVEAGRIVVDLPPLSVVTAAVRLG